VKVVQAVLEYNADVNCTVNTDVTPLHIAANKGHLEIVELLLKFGANIDCKDKYGRTALHIATEERREQIVIALLEHGSDVNIMSKDSCTPFDYAVHSKHEYYRRFRVRDPDTDVTGCGIIAEILKRHMVKMKTANLFVSKVNLCSISSFESRCFKIPCALRMQTMKRETGSNANVSFYGSLTKGISQFQNECEEEIASMKTEKFSNANVSFYDILTKGIRQLARYAANESIVQILRSDDYKMEFPIYASMINNNFRKGEKRKELLEKGNKIFHFHFNKFPQLPRDCIEEIFSYLSDEDLRILVNACKPISVSTPNTDIIMW
jgi:hypothetical protein